jgi:uncharacterized protein YigA (DUF484 family)
MTQKTEDAAGKTAARAADRPVRRARIAAADVAEYLRQHPDFLAEHPEALDGQRLPEKAAGGVVDLQQFMLERLRRDVTRLRTEQDDLLANSRDNLSTQARVHDAVLALLEAQSLAGLVEIVTTDLAIILDVDVVTLCLERNSALALQSRVAGVQLLDPGVIDQVIGSGRDVLLRDEVEGDARVFGGAAGLVRSDALLRLHFDEAAPLGLIAFGTRHPGYFDSGQGTELLGFLARILEHCVRSWLNWPD